VGRIAWRPTALAKQDWHLLAVVLARENGLPFYSVVPTSTVDCRFPRHLIPIEERGQMMCSLASGRRAVAPAAGSAPAIRFDVTPHAI